MIQRKKKTSGTASDSRHRPSYLVVSRFDSLPRGVHCIFTTTLRDAQAAARRKQKTLGLNGNITTVIPYEVHPQIAAKVEQAVRASLPQFQFGKEVLVKCSLEKVHRAIEAVFSDEPRQVALQFQILSVQIQSLEDKVVKLQTENAQLAAQKVELVASLRKSKLREHSLNEDFHRLRKELGEANDQIAELQENVERMVDSDDLYY